MTIAQIAAYWDCPVTYERLLRVGTAVFNGYRYEHVIPWNSSEDTWATFNGVINHDLLMMLSQTPADIRNVTLQLRELDSLSEEEAKQCFRLAFGFQGNGLQTKHYPERVFIQAEREGEGFELTLWHDGEWFAARDDWATAFNASALLSYLRSIHVRVEGKEVAGE